MGELQSENHFLNTNAEKHLHLYKIVKNWPQISGRMLFFSKELFLFYSQSLIMCMFGESQIKNSL